MAGVGRFSMASTEKERESLDAILLPTALVEKSLPNLSEALPA